MTDQPERPSIGTVVYGGPNKEKPLVVVGHVWENGIVFVPLGTDWCSTHQGNVYNENGESQWRIY
jgi:hypothetical protein